METKVSSNGLLLGNVTVYPIRTQLWVPPVKWLGYPAGHVTRDNSFFYLVEGECFLSIDDEKYVLTRNQLVLLPKGKFVACMPHAPNNVKLYEMQLVAESEGMDVFKQLQFTDNNHVVNISENDRLCKLFEETTLVTNPSELTFIPARIERCANTALIVSLYLRKRLEQFRKDTVFDEVIEYMKVNLKGNLNLSLLAEMVYMSPTYFIRKFKNVYGKSPISFYNDLRANNAMHLLSTTDMTLEQIGKNIGFEDKHYFSYFFKNTVGVSPTEYRKFFGKSK